MSLLEEIQNSAVDSKGDIGELLRKCKVLAARLGSKSLEEWLIHESNGYPSNVDLPVYRICKMELKGQFSGPFGSGLRNAPIPPLSVPDSIRETVTEFHCRQSAASIEETLKKYHGGGLQISLGADLAVLLGASIYQNMNCLQAWGEVNGGSLIEILNTVRNRILDFVLAIWKENPEAGNLPIPMNKITPEKVNQIFNTTIHGGVANIVGAAHDSNVNFEVKANDFESLANYLKAYGIDQPDINELMTAIRQDPKPTDAKKLGPGVAAWIGKMTAKAVTGAWTVTTGTATGLLVSGLKWYYGLP